MESNGSFRIQADLILDNRVCFAPGQIEIRHGRITEVTGRTLSTPDVVAEGVALLPGLVNPHTHLEFSDLQQPLSAEGNFPAWVGRVLRQRQSRSGDVERLLTASIQAGLVESLCSGVFGVVDIVTPPWNLNSLEAAQVQTQSQVLHEQPLDRMLSPSTRKALAHHLPRPSEVPRVIACIEQLGLMEERVTQATQWRDSLLEHQRAGWPERLHSIGVSPHAPYSTPESLWRSSLLLAAEQQRLVAMHLVESREERQWLDAGTGPFAELLTRLGADHHRAKPHLIESVCTALARAPHALIIHGNYLSLHEMDHLGELRQRLSVVYCPRTHKHFGHDSYPLDQLRQRGVRVVFGTDSRSSNPDLNLWQEARCALQRHASLSPTEAFSAITDSAARAIGLERELGALAVGSLAALNILPLPPGAWLHDIDALFAEWFQSVAHPLPLIGFD